ncbi:hypothetical protein CPB84DRAFT_1773317, partial [Gymnopilus junonius]
MVQIFVSLIVAAVFLQGLAARVSKNREQLLEPHCAIAESPTMSAHNIAIEGFEAHELQILSSRIRFICHRVKVVVCNCDTGLSLSFPLCIMMLACYLHRKFSAFLPFCSNA